MLDGKIINNKILLHTAQWYITHTCNLPCEHCLSHNNFAIKGEDSFEDNIEHAKEWNRLVTIKDFTIIGGEVFTHNNLNQWVHGLRDIFSDVKDFKVLTNGTLLEKYYDSFDSWFDKDIIIELSFKREKDFKNFMLLLQRYKNYDIKDHFLYDKVIYIDGKLRFLIEHCTTHVPWAVKDKIDGVYNFWDNDPEESHKKCWQKDCHYFHKGELYKCGTLVGAKEFVKKYPVKYFNKKLYEDYKPIQYTDTNLQKKITSLNFAVNQCSSCPIDNGKKDKIVLDKRKIMP